MRIAAYIGIVLALVSFGALSIFNVPVDSEALVLRGTEVQRKVGPGLQFRMPFFENVVTVPVLREQQFSYDTAFEIQGCQAAVSVIYRIGDLEEYHASSGELTALTDKRPAIEASLDALPDLSGFAQSDKPYADQISERLKSLSGPASNGVYINRIRVALEDGCEPKRIVKETPLPSLSVQQVDVFGSERVAPGNLRVATSDGVEIQIEGFVATYEIDDRTRAETCFGKNGSIVATRVGSLAEATVREVVENLTLAELEELPARLVKELPNNNLAQCGLSLGAVDFNLATFARRSVVNCDETLTEDCFPKSFVIPGLAVQD
ncbi:MAG: hypothetical protein AAGB10_19540 [Pseudomonadota bacterium]